jgi:hypothetical protein
VTSGLDLALWFVERYLGPDAALEVEREMEYERRGTVWRRPEQHHPPHSPRWVKTDHPGTTYDLSQYENEQPPEKP